MSFIVDKLEEWLAPHRQAGADLLPVILMGDFNAEPGSDEIRFLRGYHAPPSATSGQLRGTYFNDALQFVGGDTGPTFARDNVFACSRARARPPPRLHLRPACRPLRPRPTAHRPTLLPKRPRRHPPL